MYYKKIFDIKKNLKLLLNRNYKAESDEQKKVLGKVYIKKYHTIKFKGKYIAKLVIE